MENNTGDAEFIIKVKGRDSDIRIYVDLYKQSAEEWAVERLEIVD